MHEAKQAESAALGRVIALLQDHFSQGHEGPMFPAEARFLAGQILEAVAPIRCGGDALFIDEMRRAAPAFEQAYQLWREQLADDDPQGLPVAQATGDSLFEAFVRVLGGAERPS